jgi:excisionase family DNA binding protein
MNTEDMPTIGALTVKEFSKLYSLGRTRIYEEIDAGRLRAVKIGAATRISRAEAERWFASLPALRAA